MVYMKYLNIFLITFLFVSFLQGENSYKFEGYSQEPDGERRLIQIARLLHYNPVILIVNPTKEIVEKCNVFFPKGTLLSYSMDQLVYDRPIDLIWLNCKDSELCILKTLNKQLQTATIIYTTTHFSNHIESNYYHLKTFLEQRDFALFGHWYWEEKGGEALFLKSKIYDAAMRSLSFGSQKTKLALPYIPQSNLESFFHKIEGKSDNHSLKHIDFIYMINLDERPEKFDSALKCLNPYGINPYRFSAVNGWKLPYNVLDQIGVKFSPLLKFSSWESDEKLMGTVYRESDGKSYMSNELMQEIGTSYFAFGMARGAIGCILSHLSVLQDAYDAEYKTIWIMEDDIQVIKNPLQLSSLIEELDLIDPDWDILFTDIDSKNKEGQHVPCRALAVRPNFKMEPLEHFLKKFYPAGKNFRRIGMRYGTYSMIIRRSGIEKILNHFKDHSIFLPYDMDYWLEPSIRMYTVNEDILSTLPEAFSDNGAPNYNQRI